MQFATPDQQAAVTFTHYAWLNTSRSLKVAYTAMQDPQGIFVPEQE